MQARLTVLNALLMSACRIPNEGAARIFGSTWAVASFTPTPSCAGSRNSLAFGKMARRMTCSSTRRKVSPHAIGRTSSGPLFFLRGISLAAVSNSESSGGSKPDAAFETKPCSACRRDCSAISDPQDASFRCAGHNCDGPPLAAGNCWMTVLMEASVLSAF